MKYTITGSLGNISKPLAEKLVAAGQDVTVITSDAAKAESIRKLGAKPAVGSIEDPAFVTAAFAGADAVYAMVPPNFGATDWLGWIEKIGNIYAEAIRKAGVKKVVQLSSVGADLPSGVGPVSGIHRVEESFRKLNAVDVLTLRAGFFYTNLLANIPMILEHGIIGGNYGAHTRLVLVHPDDIASAAAEALLNPVFTAKTVRYVTSDLRTTDEIAKVLGSAIGKPNLPWVDFSDADTLAAYKAAGLSDEIASKYVEMGGSVRSGDMFRDYFAVDGKPQGKIKLEDFAKTFAAAFPVTA